MPRATTPVHAVSSRTELRRSGPTSDPELRRELGVVSATLLVVGGIIGSGIFFTPAEVARALPAGPWILGVWALGGLVALAGALTYAELGAMMPNAGGPYVYIREAFGPMPAFLYGWMALALIASGALAAVAMGFATSLGRLLNLGPVGGPLGVAATTIVVLSATNYLGIKPGAVVANVLTVTKIIALAVLILGGFALWTTVAPPPSVPNAPPPRASLLVGLAAAFPPVLFTVGGWQQMNMVAGEIRNPETSIPRALVIGIAIVIACYLGANGVYLHVLGRDALAASTAVAGDTALRLAGSVGGKIIAVAVMLSILGFVNVVLLTNSRIIYAMSRDGVFFPSFGQVHPRFGSPHRAIVLMGAWSLVLLVATRGSLGALLSGVVFADWIFFGLGAASVFVLRRTQPDAERPYRAKGYPIVPGFFVIAACAGILSAFVSSLRMSLVGVGLVMLGAMAYAMAGKTAPTGPDR
jgi:basic amino acid/polyamine antiporter, APA family